MPSGVLTIAYIGAAILFILALGGLSHPETARRGNVYGIIGMGVALVATVGGVVDGRQIQNLPLNVNSPVEVLHLYPVASLAFYRLNPFGVMVRLVEFLVVIPMLLRTYSVTNLADLHLIPP